MFAQSVFRYTSRWRNSKYHLRNANLTELRNYEKQRSGHSRLPWFDLLRCSWQHGASFDDYYVLSFFNKTAQERREYLTRSLYYELERQKTPLDKAQVIRDKAQFIQHFKALLGRQAWSWQELEEEIHLPPTPPPKLVFKPRWGACGIGIEFPEQHFTSWASVRAYLCQLGTPEHYICEEYIAQHPSLQKINPDSVSTLRVMIWQEKGQIKTWSTALRVGMGQGPDNWNCGGAAFAVDSGGVVCQPGVFKSPFRPPISRHPVSQEKIVGLTLPFYQEVHSLIQKSTQLLPDLPSVGWDIALSTQGPCLIEGNDRWSIQFLQRLLNRGCRDWFEPLCDLHQVYD